MCIAIFVGGIVVAAAAHTMRSSRLLEAVPLLDHLEGTGFAMIARESGDYADILAKARVLVAGVLRVPDVPQ